MFADDDVGFRLQSSRAALSLSQNQLAVVSGLAVAQISRYESGRSKPRPEAIGKLAKALNVRPEWLARGELPVQAPGQEHEIRPAAPGQAVVELELPDDLSAFIQEAAKKNGLTMEMQILAYLREADPKLFRKKKA